MMPCRRSLAFSKMFANGAEEHLWPDSQRFFRLSCRLGQVQFATSVGSAMSVLVSGPHLVCC